MLFPGFQFLELVYVIDDEVFLHSLQFSITGETCNDVVWYKQEIADYHDAKENEKIKTHIAQVTQIRQE